MLPVPLDSAPPSASARTRGAACALVLAALAVLAVAPPSAMAKPENGKVFQDWRVRCETPKGQKKAKEVCFVFQQLLLKNKKKKEPLLTIVAGYIGRKAQPALHVRVPLGVWLRPGLSVKVDDGKKVPFAYERCDPGGCVGALDVSADLLKQLEAGKRALVTFQATLRDGRRRDVSVPVSLKGFTAAFGSLQ